VELGYAKNIMYRTFMIVKVSAGGNTNIVHIDTNGRAQWFVFEYGVTIDEIHHRLERRW